MAAPQPLVVNTLLTGQPQPVAVDAEIEALVKAVKSDAEQRYALVHGESAAKMQFGAPSQLLEALAELTKDGICYYVKLVLGDNTGSLADTQPLVGLKIARTHQGQVGLEEMVAVDTSSLASQLRRFTPPEDQIVAAESVAAIDAVACEPPRPVAVDSKVEELCRAVRAMAERASPSLSEGASFADFTPIEAMVSAQPGGTACYVKLRTGGQALAGPGLATGSEYVAVKLMQSHGGRFVDLAGPVLIVAESLPLARALAQLDAASEPPPPPPAQQQQPPAPRPYPGGGLSAAPRAGGPLPLHGAPPAQNSREEIELSGWVREVRSAPLLRATTRHAILLHSPSSSPRQAYRHANPDLPSASSTCVSSTCAPSIAPRRS